MFFFAPTIQDRLKMNAPQNNKKKNKGYIPTIKKNQKEN